MTALERAREITEELFQNGFGEKAARLVLEVEDGRNGGGWCKGAVRDRIEVALLAHAEAVREEAVQRIMELPVLHRIGISPLCDQDQAEEVVRDIKVE